MGTSGKGVRVRTHGIGGSGLSTGKATIAGAMVRGWNKAQSPASRTLGLVWIFGKTDGEAVAGAEHMGRSKALAPKIFTGAMRIPDSGLFEMEDIAVCIAPDTVQLNAISIHMLFPACGG